MLHQLDLHLPPKKRAGQLNPLAGSSVQRETRGGVPWRDWERVPEDPSVTCELVAQRLSLCIEFSRNGKFEASTQNQYI